MLGHSHALSGLCVGAAALPFAPVHGGAEQVAWVAAWGGFAMLPDLDQRGATIARMWGPVTNVLARGVGWAAGGHRNGTHSVLGMLATGLLAVLLNLTHVGQIALLALGIGLALRALAFVIPGHVETTIVGNILLSWGGAWWLTQHGHGYYSWLPAAALGGAIVHVAGDMLTVGGVPLAYPQKSRQALHLFKTGATVETAVIAPVFFLLAVWQMYVHTGLLSFATPALTAIGAHL